VNDAAALSPTYAGLGKRFLAFFLDSMVWLVAISWVASAIPADASVTTIGIVFLILFNLWFNYFWIAEWRYGQTIGKNAFGIRVTTDSGERPAWNAAAMRNLLRLVDVLVVGPILIAASRKKQRLGDRAAHTVVVRDREREAAAERARARREAGTTVVAGGAGPEAATVTAESRPAPPTEHAPPPDDGAGIPAGSWRPIQVLYGVLIAIVLLIVEGLVVSAFDPDLESVAADLSLQALLAGTLGGVAVGFAARGGQVVAALGRLGLRRFKPSAAGLALATYGGYVAFSVLLAPLLHPQQEDITRDLGFDESGLAAVVAGVLIVGAAPISEEMFFRGFIFAGIRRRLPLWPAAAISGAIFGVVHLTAGSIGVGIQLTVFGMLLAWLYEYTGSLWPSILTHTINNTLAFIIVVTT
jgi:membrane protease YdiL (CAAX protease family)/uncharacterized RDD family membrane protein YckC